MITLYILTLYLHKLITADRGIDIFGRIMENVDLINNGDVKRLLNNGLNFGPASIIDESTSYILQTEYGPGFDLKIVQDKVAACLMHDDNTHIRNDAKDFMFMQLFDTNDDICSVIQDEIWDTINTELVNNIAVLISYSIYDRELAALYIPRSVIDFIFDDVDIISAWLQEEIYSLQYGDYLIKDLSLHILHWLTTRKSDSDTMFACDEESLQIKLQQATDLIHECNSETWAKQAAQLEENHFDCNKLSISLDLVVFAQIGIEVAGKIPPVEAVPFYVGLGFDIFIGGGIQIKGDAQTLSFWGIQGGLILSGELMVWPHPVVYEAGIIVSVGYVENLNELLQPRMDLGIMFSYSSTTAGVNLHFTSSEHSSFDLTGGALIYGKQFTNSAAAVDISIGGGSSWMIHQREFNPVALCKKLQNGTITLRPSTHPTINPITPAPIRAYCPKLNNDIDNKLRCGESFGRCNIGLSGSDGDAICCNEGSCESGARFGACPVNATDIYNYKPRSCKYQTCPPINMNIACPTQCGPIVNVRCNAKYDETAVCCNVDTYTCGNTDEYCEGQSTDKYNYVPISCVSP